MRKWIIILLSWLFLAACEDTSETKNVIGKYVNTFEPEANHYVEIKSDSTYIHYYKKASEPAKVNKGNWRLSVRPHKTEVVFRKWISFGYFGVDSCSECLWAVKLVDEELIFNVDLPDERNFKKVEDL